MDDLVAFARLIDALPPGSTTSSSSAGGHTGCTDKRAQDALYVHDTLELFGGQLPALRTLWSTHLQRSLPKTTLTRLARLRREQFGSVTDVHRAAVRIPQDRTIAPDLLQARCAFGLDEIFGD